MTHKSSWYDEISLKLSFHQVRISADNWQCPNGPFAYKKPLYIGSCVSHLAFPEGFPTRVTDFIVMKI